jgi:hypothetical protein
LANVFTITVNVIVTTYLIFRFYLLVNLNKKAKKLSLTLPEFLNRRDTKCGACEKCGNID